MSKNSEAVKKWRRNAKARLIKAFGGSCSICGYCKCEEVMEFHHLDPSTKETSWGQIRGSIKSWDSIVDEMQKCVMLCSNCHKEVHAGVSHIPDNVKRLDLEATNYKNIEKQLMMDKCPHCETLKKKDKKTCGNIRCVSKRPVRKVNWLEVDLIELMNKYKSFEAAGDALNVSGAAVSRQWKKRQKG